MSEDLKADVSLPDDDLDTKYRVLPLFHRPLLIPAAVYSTLLLVAYFAAVYTNRTGWKIALPFALAAPVLGLLIAHDFSSYRLPNKLVATAWAILIPTSVIAILMIPDEDPLSTYAWAFVGAMFITVLLYALALLFGGIGLGDVKLSGALAFAVGINGIVYVPFSMVLFPFALGSVVGLVLIATKRADNGTKTKIPFGPYLILGPYVGMYLTYPVATMLGYM